VGLGLAAVGMIVLQFLLPERIDTGSRRMLTLATALVGMLWVLGWFFFASGLAMRVRLGVALVLFAAVIALGTSLRRVEFSGDMVPSFDWRWNQDRYAALEEHRTRSSETPENPVLGRVDLADVTPGQEDVLDFRGARRDGVSPGPALARDWKTMAPKLLWRQPVGGGYASFLKIGPALITIEQRRDQEAIVAYEADSGQELWVHEYPALFSETLGGDGPRATPTYHDGKIYSLGATGELVALEFATGKKLWQLNILKDNECGNLDWGMSGSPLVYEDVVIVNPGDQKGTENSRAIVAYALADGQRRWAAGRAKASYASPMLVTLGGTPQLLIFDGVGLAGCDLTDGHELWRSPWKSDFDINAAQPVVLDNESIAITSASGSAVVRVKPDAGEWKAEQVWTSRRLKGGYASPMAYDGALFGIDESILVAIDLTDGKQKWKNRQGQYGHGQILRRDDLLLILGEAGELVLVEANPTKFSELARIQAIEGKTWNVPLLVGNRVYVRNHLEMAAYELPTEEIYAPEAAPPIEPTDGKHNADRPLGTEESELNSKADE
jgi:outer membrane protein assembly factor BamB